ncbi:hypothetical protein ABEB36_001918 [Hypothenemus hampei]|uniref:Uncharacterized protein n=1 Tax=Hypothenemus hampei TaxID=57062 RepID=A0ABD1FI27_HYPHA
MDKIVTENLFLLEFLVDNVDMEKKCECDIPPGETCVSFQFLDNAPLDVCEADFAPGQNLKAASSSTVKVGKSCLFSLSPNQAVAATEQFDIFVSVMKKMQPGWLPERVEIGGCVIGIANMFNQLISCVELSDGNCPTAKTLKDEFNITDSKGGVIGKISVYIRMSCFGKLIVTQFQMNLEDKSVLFKDKEGKNLYRYKKAGKKKLEDPGPYDMGGGNYSYNPNCPQTPCPPSYTQPSSPQSNLYSCPFAPCGDPHNGDLQKPVTSTVPLHYPTSNPALPPCMECGYSSDPICVSGVPAMSMYPTPSPRPPPDGNYQEIGASMGGNSLTIRVHKDKGKAEQVNLDDNCTCGSGNQLVPTTGRSQQQAFAMRPGASPNVPFSFKMGQCGDSAPSGNNVVVNPPVYTAPDGTQFTEFSDPNKETFILRIGKKTEGVDKKNNLELELQTPKGPPLKPLPRKETVETQYDPLDAGPGADTKKDKKGKKKGAKANKKKKGKGKKKK